MKKTGEDKDIQKLNKEADKNKKSTIGLAAIMVLSAVGGVLTFALGGPVVLGFIFIIAEVGFGAGAVGCAGKYSGIKKILNHY